MNAPVDLSTAYLDILWFQWRLDRESSIRKRGSTMKAIGTQILQTERLILRRFIESDAEAMFQNWASSAENLTYVTWNPHPDVEVTRNSICNWVGSYTNPNYYKWAICLKENPEQVIGEISIAEMNEDDSSCEIGYVLGKTYWGNGMMTEALKSVLTFVLLKQAFKRSELVTPVSTQLQVV